MQSGALYKFIGAAVRSPTSGTSAAVLLTLLNLLGSGFVLIRSEMPVYWRWFTWVAPLSYTFTCAPALCYLGMWVAPPSHTLTCGLASRETGGGEIALCLGNNVASVPR